MIAIGMNPNRKEPPHEKMVTVTHTNFPECKHANGWYHTVEFWIFQRRFFACNDCGKLVELSKWTV